MYMTRVSLTTALLAVRRRSAGACLALLAVGPGLAHPASASDWPDTVSGRLAAEVELGELSLALLTRDSATLVLDEWCRRHRIDPAAKIVAERIRGAETMAPPEIRAALRIAPTETIAYRHVRLKCGTRTLSEADNWYVPSRLSPAINQALETSDIAFGRAVLSLRFKRVGTSSRRLWSPLPPGWEHLPAAAWPRGKTLAIPDFVLENQALLVISGDLPISAVIERYTREVLSSVPPVARRSRR